MNLTRLKVKIVVILYIDLQNKVFHLVKLLMTVLMKSLGFKQAIKFSKKGYQDKIVKNIISLLLY
jgi:hypothetical protein